MLTAHCLLGLALTAPAPQDPPVPDFWLVIERAIENADLRPEFDSVLEHLRGIDVRRASVGHRLSRVNAGLAQPWTPPAMAADLRDLLAAPIATRKGPRFSTLPAGIAGWLDLDSFEPSRPDSAHPGLRELATLWEQVIDPELKGIALLEAMSAYLDLAHLLLEEALSGLDPAQQAVLFEGHAGFFEAYHRDHFPGTQLTSEQDRAMRAFKVLLAEPRSDRALILGVYGSLLNLAEPEFLSGLPRRLARVDAEVDRETYGRDTLAVVGTEARNRVVLSGRKGSTHTLPAALLIDLDGDDEYQRAAVVDSPDMLVSLVLDLGGDDTYRGTGAGPAFAAGGVALLVDREGNDHYLSGRLGQAATALGCAALIDLEGDDEYVAEDFSQGHATCGVALLYDFEGQDTYTSWAAAQGGGIGYGLCALVDGEGDDSYVADLHWPDVYGNSGKDVYHGAAQGYSTGIRPEVAGGIAALVDLGDGTDRYQAGSFSQGGGYYFSFGLMYDGGGDDETLGSRYAQGFGVHQGLGVRWDAAGDDRYTCRSVAHAGMAWDEGVGYLLEDGGDDVYRTGDLSCGGAAQTGIAICIDRGGADEYHTGRESQGGTGASEYHNQPSVGVLIDLGGKRDSYTAEGREDSSVRVLTGIELFLDLAARDMRAALKSKQLR